MKLLKSFSIELWFTFVILVMVILLNFSIAFSNERHDEERINENIIMSITCPLDGSKARITRSIDNGETWDIAYTFKQDKCPKWPTIAKGISWGLIYAGWDNYIVVSSNNGIKWKVYKIK